MRPYSIKSLLYGQKTRSLFPLQEFAPCYFFFQDFLFKHFFIQLLYTTQTRVVLLSNKNIKEFSIAQWLLPLFDYNKISEKKIERNKKKAIQKLMPTVLFFFLVFISSIIRLHDLSFTCSHVTRLFALPFVRDKRNVDFQFILEEKKKKKKLPAKKTQKQP